MVDILVPTAKLKFPKKQVFPSPGDLMLDCGKCGSQQYRVHVRPFGPDLSEARVTEVVCARCLRVIHVLETGVLESEGKVRLEKGS